MTKAPQNPLQIPELRAQVARFLALGDTVACAQVCKAWTDHFVYPIWHTIDFAGNTWPKKLGSAVIAKYGHHIRIVKNLKDMANVNVILWSRASKLKELSIAVQDKSDFQAYCYDIIRRSSTTLLSLDISCLASSRSYLWLAAFYQRPGTATTSKLSSLTISRLQLTRDAFSALLQQCPLLNTLEMKDIVIHCSFESDMFQHCGLKELYASINQVFTMDPSFPGAPSLFIHFPNLEDWNTEYRTPTPTISMDVIAKDVARYCPLLKGLHTGTGGDITKDLLLQVFRNLSTIVVSYKILSADIVTAILSHHNTLEHLMTFIPHDGFLESDNVPALTDQLQHSRRAIDLLPQLCTKLKLLCLSLHEMHIDEIEQVTWGCKGLEALHIRIHGLNTKEKIDRTIQLWRDGRAKSTALKDGAGALQCDTSIEARVARHLLRFEKLRKIWLGHKIRTINGPL